MWLLDKVFARLPELKPQYKEQEHGMQHKDQLPEVDTRVSSDYSKLHQRLLH